MRTVLFLEAARRYIPAPRANFVRLVINGESWGIYTNVQQFDTTFARDCFGTRKGARWKVPGSPRGRGGFAYLGDDVEAYRQIYALKSKENPKAWVSLILLCKRLSETPVDRLETALAPILDVDGVLRFLALDNALVNNDGFWARASDYCLYQDVHGRFHIVPHDVNESFAAGGFGPPGGRRPGRADPGPLLARPLVTRADRNGDRKLDREEFTSLADLWFASAGVDRTAPITRRPFVAGLTAWFDQAADTGDRSRSGEGEPSAPRRRRRFSPLMFAGNDLFRAIAENWLDWEKTGPLVHRYRALIEDDVKTDTRKLDSTQAFVEGIDGGGQASGADAAGRAGASGGARSLQSFFERRRAFLLQHPAVKSAPRL